MLTWMWLNTSWRKKEDRFRVAYGKRVEHFRGVASSLGLPMKKTFYATLRVIAAWVVNCKGAKVGYGYGTLNPCNSGPAMGRSEGTLCPGRTHLPGPKTA